MNSKDFRGEVWNNVDEYVLSEIVRSNAEAVDGKVGQDSYTARATAYLQSHFEQEIAVLYTINGTAANIVALKALLHNYGAVICADQAHINTHECGAVEFNLGTKLLSAPTEDAKLTPAIIDQMLEERKGQTYYPEVLAVTQPTELGTLYTNEEMKALADYAHARGMKLFVDGARLGSALATLGCTLGEWARATDVDVFTVGGTKSGAMFGEAVVFTSKKDLVKGDYILKQSLQHFDKSKFLGVQMNALFENDRWIKNFAHANAMARLLERELLARGIEIYLPVESNMVFCVLDKKQLDLLGRAFDLKYWYEDKKVVRICTTFATQEKTIMELVSLL